MSSAGGLAPIATAAAPEGWGLGTLLEMSDVGLAYNVRVATNGDGRAVYTWSQTEGAVDLIHARIYDAAFGWGETTVIQTDTSDYGDQAFPVMDTHGNAMAVWASYGSPQQAWAARYDAAGGWEPAVRLDIGISDADRVRPAVDASGNVMAVWQQSDNLKNDIWADRYVVGSGWGTPTRIEASDGGAVQPWLTSDSAGNAIAVWVQTDGGVRKTTANRFVAGTGWGTASMIETGTSGNASLPFVDSAADGRAVAVWSKSNGSGFNAWSAFYTPGTGWAAPVLMENDEVSSLQPSGVGVDDSGRAVAAMTRCTTFCGLSAVRSTTWGAWEAPQSLDPPGLTNTNQPRVGINPAGDAVAVFPALTGTTWDIWAARYSVAGGWSAAEKIEHDNRGDSATAFTAVDNHGVIFAGWDDYNGSAANAWANIYFPPAVPDTALADRLDALDQRIAELSFKLDDANQKLLAANDNAVALSGRLATLSIFAAVALFAAIGGIGITVVQLRRAGKTKAGEVHVPKESKES